MFLSNEREFGGLNKYKYGDIKLNVLLEHGGISLCCEIQFLLSFLLSAKQLGHGLYEVERQAEFIHDMNDILSITQNKPQQLFYIINAGNNGFKFQQQLSQLLFCYQKELDLIEYDARGMNTIHYICKSGNEKLADLIFSSFKNSKKLIEILSAPSHTADSEPAVLLACESNNPEMLKRLATCGIDLYGVYGKNKITPLIYSIEKGCYASVKYLIDTLMSDDVINISKQKEKSRQSRESNCLYAALFHSQYRILNLLLESGKFDVNFELAGNVTAFSVASLTTKRWNEENEEESLNFLCFKRLFEEKNINIKRLGEEKYLNTFLFNCIENKKVGFVKYAFDNLDINNFNFDKCVEFAAKLSSYKILALILNFVQQTNNKVDINHCGATGTPLHLSMFLMCLWFHFGLGVFV